MYIQTSRDAVQKMEPDPLVVFSEKMRGDSI